MKHLKLFFALFAMLALGVGNAWAESETVTFTNKDWAPWTKITSGSSFESASPSRGVANNGVNGSCKSSKSYSNITKISYVASSNTTGGKVTIKVGETTVGETSIPKANNQTFEYAVDNLSGVITLSVTKPSSKTVYVKSITIETSTAAPDPVDPKASFNDASYTVGQTLDLSTLWTSNSDGAVTYTIDNAGTTGASINGKSFTATAAGTCTVKASQAATSAYNAIEKTATITVTEPTPATVTLSEAGAVTNVADKNVDDAYTLPSTSTQTCGDKVFVGWSTVEISNPSDKPTNYFYEPGTTVTLAAEQTFYAVYATKEAGGGNVFDGSAGGTFKIYAVVNGTNYYAKGTGSKISSTTNEGEATEYTFTKISDGVFSIKTSSTYITYASSSNLGTNNTTAYNWNISTGTNGTWRIASVATNTRGFIYRASTYNQFGGYALSNATAGSTEYFDVEIGSGSSASYSDYTTSCGATPTIYNVTIAGDIQNGTVTASPTSAAEGATITLTVTPADGYMLNTLAVADESSNLISVTDNKFEMPASNVTVSATFKEIPAATLTLSKNGDTSDKIEGKVGDVINLPTFTSDCSKTFVGWDSKSDCAVAPEYAPGAEYTLASETQTLYAVYANAIEGALVNVFSETFDACEGSGGNDSQWSGNIASTAFPAALKNTWTVEYAYAANKCAKFGGSSAKKGIAETPAITLTGAATLTFRAGAWDNSSEVTTLNLFATGANLSQSSITLTKAAWTEYTIHITEATGSVKIKFEASVEDKNRFFLDDVVVSQASVTYSDYSTTCTAALDAPTFTPVAGTYNEVTNVTISATDGDVYYTLDGTTPTEESEKYTAPIVLNTNGTTTIKAIAISAESQSSVVTATYTIKLPLITMDEIFAAATTAGGTEAPVLITMNNWVVTGKTTKNAYVTDGTKGFVIYKENHGFEEGNVLSGTVACKVQLFKGSAELTELTSTTEGLSITTGGTVSTVVVDDVTTLSGINTGSLIKINGVHESDNIVNNVKLYNTLFSFENLTPGQEYNVTGVYLQYDATKEILPRSAADIEEVVGLPTATISIENITLVEGDKHTIVATITPDEAASKVTYSIKNGNEYISLSGNVITANAVGTATITAAIAEVDGVYHGTTKDFTVTVNEYVAPISGTWKLVTDASTLKAGMEVIVAQYVEADGTIYTMGAQKTNNRDVVESSVLGETLTPTTGTAVLTLVDAGNGTFALQADNDKYLYAASNTSNHLKETATINDNAKWSISVTEGKASVVAQGDNSRNTIRFNKSNTPKIFSCYEGGQTDIALYALVPDHIREVPVGYFATICVPNNIVKVVGATLYKVAGKENGKLYFDEVLVEETVEGMPYVFFTELETQEFYFGTKTTSTAGKEKSLKGTFVKLEDEDLQGHYMLQSNKIIKCADTGCWIDPNRAYFDGNDLSTLSKPSAQMPGRRRVSMGAEEENETTGTENIVAPEGQTLKLIENGQLIIIRNGEKYNVQGIKL